MDKISTPPGFVSQTTFLLKRKCDDKESSILPSSTRPSRSAPGQEEITKSDFKRYLLGRPWILHDLRPNASKALQHKVPAKLFPEVKKTEGFDEAPVFHPSEEEFNDTLGYIESLRHKVEPHGICCVVPPPSWKPSCLLKNKKIWEDSSFATQSQLFGGRDVENIETKSQANRDAKSDATSKPVQCCRIEAGPQYTLSKFKGFADSFKKQHFHRKSSSLLVPAEPTVAEIEQEYKQLLIPNAQCQVLYGNDLDTSIFGSGFPTSEASEPCKYSKSGWNLNNTAKLPGSILSLDDCKSVSVPRLSIGMCFSSELWKVEKDLLYSLCYLHFGASRVWYAVPGHCSFKFKTEKQSFNARFSKEEPEAHCENVMMMSPYELIKESVIPVTRCVQSPGQFVVIFPGSYYSGFDCGFNCLEKVNFAPIDWLPHGDAAVILNQEKRKRPYISYDKLLLQVAREVVRYQCRSLLLRKTTLDSVRWRDARGTDGILYKILKSRVKQHGNQVEYLSRSLKSLRMDENSEAVTKRECCVCFVDLYLSAVQCSCSVHRYSCLNHAEQLCPCGNKMFLYRYNMDELNVLVEAVEGKFRAMYTWARGFLDFSLYSPISVESSTSTPASKQGDKKLDNSLLGEAPCDSRKKLAAKIIEQVKARVRERSLEESTKVKQDKSVTSVVSEVKTMEKPKSKMKIASEDVLHILTSSDSDDEIGTSSRLQNMVSNKEKRERSSDSVPLKSSSPKRQR